MNKANIYNNSISSRAVVILDYYYDQLNKDIDQNGYCTEFLNNADDYENTRLLCQTRCMYFLVEYSLIREDTKAFNQALKLYDLIKKDYYSQADKCWYQYPNREKLDNLYEYAFLIFSISKLYSVIKKDELKSDLTELHQYIQLKYFHPETNFDNLKDEYGRVSQNALMHLFESYLELYKIIPNDNYKNILLSLLSSVKNMFYDSGAKLISEYFPHGDNDTIYEPGHSFEWACLLLESKGFDININENIHYEKLISSAEKFGVTSQGAVFQSLSGLDDKNRYRIWPMLERLRYYVMNQDAEKVNNIFPEFDAIFICQRTNMPIEFVNSELASDFDGVKTTTAYHLINSLKHLLS